MNVDWDLFQNLGKRKAQEDTYSIKQYGDIFYFAIFDGHGSDKVSDYLADDETGLFAALKGIDFSTDPQIVIPVFCDLDQRIQKTVSKERDGGSTAIAVVIKPNGIAIYNVGDSRAVVYDLKEKEIYSSRDHKPTHMTERARIWGKGGIVKNQRVTSPETSFGYTTSRAFGDFELKRRFPNSESEIDCDGVLSSRPDVSFIPFFSTRPLYIVLGSDGLWDVFRNDEVGEIVTQTWDPEDKSLELKKKINQLAENTMIARDATDNVTIILIRVDSPQICEETISEPLRRLQECSRRLHQLL